MVDYDENLIKITEYEVLGKLPDPFLKSDGTRVKTAAEFDEHKKEIYKTAVELQYGTMPPKPEVLRVDTIYKGGEGRSSSYRITAGTGKQTLSFIMQVFVPKGESKMPFIVDGDGCFDYARDKEFLNAMLENGVGYVLFNRTELANDVPDEGRRQGPLYNIYPDYSFGAIGAWAWGYSRCVDALEIIKHEKVDLDYIAFTGHSRGAKTAMLAGVLDERAKVVNPNETCAGSCGCYRIHIKALTEDGGPWQSEKLDTLSDWYGYWLGENMRDYAFCEEKLPFDSHFLKAMVAPRKLFVSEAASDIWANPVGSWMTTMAAGEVYKLYEREENLFWYFRRGYHYHTVQDILMLVNIIRNEYYGDPLSEDFYHTPFKKPELIYDWRCPEK